MSYSKLLKLCSIPLLCVLTVTLMPSLGNAGEWHVGASLRCGDCHLQHSSEDNQPIPGGPFSTLLLKNTVNELCMSCHNGSDLNAPDIQSPVNMYATATSGESSGGFFGQAGVAHENGHDLEMGSGTPLSVDGRLLNLNCRHCHAVHGNLNYRNLLYDPGNKGDSITLEDGVEVFTEHKPDRPPTRGGSISAYNRANVGYKQNFTTWCVSCHDLLSVNSSAADPAHFHNHPSDVSVAAFGFDSHTDPAHWVAGVGEGFTNMAAGDISIDASVPFPQGGADTEESLIETATGIERVPFQSVVAVDFATARAAKESDQVFCMSCHKAHGSNSRAGQLWPYQEGGQNFIAGCQQCHNK